MLYNHQREGVRHLVKNKGVGTLHFDPGTGKTLTTLTYLSALARKKGTVTGLVVAPLAAVGVWPEEVEKWVPEDVAVQVWNLGGTIKQKIEQIRTGLPDPKLSSVWERQGPFDAPALILWVINVDVLSSRTNKAGENLADKLLAAVKKVKFDVMVVDELHQYRRYSNRQRLAARIAKVIPRRIGLTGTPMPKGPEDMYRQMQIIDPELFKMNYMQFLNEFCVMGGFQGREIISYKRVDEFAEILSRRALTVKKEDALDLPAYTDTLIPFKLSPKELKAYKELKNDLITELENEQTFTVDSALTKTLRLRQVSSGYLPGEAGEGISRLGTSKADTIKSLVQTTLETDKRIVIFTNFKQELEDLRMALAKEGTVLTIDGSVPMDERAKIGKRFAAPSDERIILIAQVRTVSTGLNWMTSAHSAIFSSLPLDRADYIQARDRLHRVGQKEHVNYYIMAGKGTIDEVIYSAHLDRASMEDRVNTYLRK